MESRYHGIHHLKRFKIMQEQEDISINPCIKIPEFTEICKTSLCLPAKKRKECRDSPPFPPNSVTATNYCLPAKKRVWAIQPFDLNVEYELPLDAKIQGNQPKDSEKLPENNNEDYAIETSNVKTEEDCVSEEEDGIVCAVCGSTDGDPTDPIVLCDGCNLMVHTTCYGHPFTKGTPEGDWFCAQCLPSNTFAQVSCCLCPVTGGALKPTTNNKWAHLVCAIYVPEVFFLDPKGREGIDCSKVPKRRWNNKCYVCNEDKNGCVIDCSEPKCLLAFHVTCGLKEELCIEYREGKKKGAIVAAFCKTHTDLWKKQEQTGKFKIVARDD